MQADEEPLVLNLVDRHFSHDTGMVAGVSPNLIHWNRDAPLRDAATVFTHEAMLASEVEQLPPHKRVGLLLESQAIIPKTYARVAGVMDRFRVVFTHSSSLLAEHPNALWIPGGGIWIGGEVGRGVVGVFEKTRNVSMLTSWKSRAPLHRRRLAYSIALSLRDRGVDVFRARSSKRVDVSTTLQRYRYSIVVENYVDDLYFTEKILNCFATGTVPIYLGAVRIGEMFDSEGIMSFHDLSGLREAIRRCGPDDYERRMPAIQQNYRASLEFRCVEDYVAARYPGVLRDLAGP